MKSVAHKTLVVNIKTVQDIDESIESMVRMVQKEQGWEDADLFDVSYPLLAAPYPGVLVITVIVRRIFVEHSWM